MGSLVQRLVGTMDLRDLMAIGVSLLMVTVGPPGREPRGLVGQPPEPEAEELGRWRTQGMIGRGAEKKFGAWRLQYRRQVNACERFPGSI